MDTNSVTAGVRYGRCWRKLSTAAIESFIGLGFEDVTARAGFEHVFSELLAGVHRQDEDLGVRAVGDDLPRRFQTAESGQRRVGTAGSWGFNFRASCTASRPLSASPRLARPGWESRIARMPRRTTE